MFTEKPKMEQITDNLLWVNAKDIPLVANYELSQIIKKQIMGRKGDVLISFKKPKIKHVQKIF